jgi:hypothetical protein
LSSSSIYTNEIHHKIKNIWEYSNFLDFFQKYKEELSISDGFIYINEIINKIDVNNFEINNENKLNVYYKDILISRNKTIGFHSFNINKNLTLIDVGGQRNERKVKKNLT